MKDVISNRETHLTLSSVQWLYITFTLYTIPGIIRLIESSVNNNQQSSTNNLNTEQKTLSVLKTVYCTDESSLHLFMLSQCGTKADALCWLQRPLYVNNIHIYINCRNCSFYETHQARVDWKIMHCFITKNSVLNLKKYFD